MAPGTILAQAVSASGSHLNITANKAVVTKKDTIVASNCMANSGMKLCTSDPAADRIALKIKDMSSKNPSDTTPANETA